jgi:cysteine desulfuration protein SufE
VKTATLDDLLEDFELFDDRKERLQYVLELGDQVEGLPDEWKIEENRVQGCLSNVWMVAEVLPGQPAVLEFRADSDSHVVRGLIAILMMLCSGRTPAEIHAMNLSDVFQRLKLAEGSLRSRSNGFHQMIKRIQRLAEAHVED